MKVKYTGQVIAEKVVIGHTRYVFNKENGYVVDIPESTERHFFQSCRNPADFRVLEASKPLEKPIEKVVETIKPKKGVK
jgi:hypothetical protein